MPGCGFSQLLDAVAPSSGAGAGAVSEAEQEEDPSLADFTLLARLYLVVLEALAAAVSAVVRVRCTVGVVPLSCLRTR
jgi:hypothetical protein